MQGSRVLYWRADSERARRRRSPAADRTRVNSAVRGGGRARDVSRSPIAQRTVTSPWSMSRVRPRGRARASLFCLSGLRIKFVFGLITQVLPGTTNSSVGYRESVKLCRSTDPLLIRIRTNDLFYLGVCVLAVRNFRLRRLAFFHVVFVELQQRDVRIFMHFGSGMGSL